MVLLEQYKLGYNNPMFFDTEAEAKAYRKGFALCCQSIIIDWRLNEATNSWFIKKRKKLEAVVDQAKKDGVIQ